MRKRQKPCGLWRFPGASYLFGSNTIRLYRAMNLQQSPNSRPVLVAAGFRFPSKIVCGEPPALSVFRGRYVQPSGKLP
jgi:hypothetical protein